MGEPEAEPGARNGLRSQKRSSGAVGRCYRTNPYIA